MFRHPQDPVREYGSRTRMSLPGPVLREADPVLDSLQSVVDLHMAPAALRDVLAYLHDVVSELWEDVEV